MDNWDNTFINRFKIKYGVSAATTFWGARYIHGFSLSDSLKLAAYQVNKLGTEYGGGPDCCPFRGKLNIIKRLNEIK